ncbi:MAG: hypothetical protein DRJ47_06615 [Thermoprotei archaeon]|nr:MAG: hypothetical protein DRJ47_06615 [Thermoprotei archaeon]
MFIEEKLPDGFIRWLVDLLNEMKKRVEDRAEEIKPRSAVNETLTAINDFLTVFNGELSGERRITLANYSNWFAQKLSELPGNIVYYKWEESFRFGPETIYRFWNPNGGEVGLYYWPSKMMTLLWIPPEADVWGIKNMQFRITPVVSAKFMIEGIQGGLIASAWFDQGMIVDPYESYEIDIAITGYVLGADMCPGQVAACIVSLALGG